MWEALIGIIGTAVLGVIAWAFRLQSRVAVLEVEMKTAKEDRATRDEALKELLDVKLENITIMVRASTERLDRIEKKLDRE
jgi:hypothetical protein